jgi:hypothetical protein
MEIETRIYIQDEGTIYFKEDNLLIPICSQFNLLFNNIPESLYYCKKYTKYDCSVFKNVKSIYEVLSGSSAWTICKTPIGLNVYCGEILDHNFKPLLIFCYNGKKNSFSTIEDLVIVVNNRFCNTPVYKNFYNSLVKNFLPYYTSRGAAILHCDTKFINENVYKSAVEIPQGRTLTELNMSLEKDKSLFLQKDIVYTKYNKVSIGDIILIDDI